MPNLRSSRIYPVPPSSPTRTEIITIADTPVPAAVGQDGKVYFSPRAICEGPGIDWPGQYVKIKADAVLSSCIEMISTHDAMGRAQVMVMLPKEMAPDVQAKLNRFQALPTN